MGLRLSVDTADGAPPWRTAPHAVLLDLDGTLVDSTHAVIRSWRWTATELSVPFERLEPFVHGIPVDQALARAVPQVDPAHRRRVAAHMLAMQADPAVPVAQIPGAGALLAALQAHPWAIVTSGDNRLARASMRKAGIPEPPVLITADDVHHGKPHPEPYLRAAYALGVDPVTCLVVEDSPAGVRSGVAAGMQVLAVRTTYSPEELTGADHVIRTLEDVQVVTSPRPVRGQGTGRPARGILRTGTDA
jgi:mannitol-1-/sugar-/sorbitol-6-phosphatase